MIYCIYNNMEDRIYMYKDFDMLTDEHFKELEDVGYTVVKDVLTKQECDVAIGDYRAWLSTFGDRFPKTFNSLIEDSNAIHLDVTWRLKLKAKPVFAQLWKTEKLLSSFDAVAIGRPPEDGAEDFQDVRKYWLHVDTTPSRAGLHAYQGALYLEEQTKKDWTFQVMERSHKLTDYFFEKFPDTIEGAKKLGHYFDMADEHIEHYKNSGCRLTRVPVPKGGMALWDSRLVHANARPLPNRKNKGRWRYVAFISMTPAIWANAEDIRKHQEAYQKVHMTTHWSSQGVIVMEPSVTAGMARLTDVPEIARTEEARQLSGVIPYDFNDGKPNGDDLRPVWKKVSTELPLDLDKERQWANGHI